MPGNVFAQRTGAGAHAGTARPGVVRAPQAPVARVPQPVFRAPGPVGNRPNATNPVALPIVIRPAGIIPMTSLHPPGSLLRTPLTGSGIFYPSRPPSRFPITPVPVPGTVGVFGTFGLRGFGYNPFWFPGCAAFPGIGYSCGMQPPFYGLGVSYGYGVGYVPPVYPSPPLYPSEPEPGYSPSDSSAALQYTPILKEYPALESLPPQDLGAPRSASARLQNEVLLYLRDGSVFAVASYTVSEGLVHYVTAYGAKGDVEVDLLDLHETIEANAARGVTFTLTPPSPVPAESSPSPLGPAPAPPGPITPPKQ
jgi:hypothetical protein